MALAECPPNYAWADNNQHMDPCEVASSLLQGCDNSLPPLMPINDPEDEVNYYRGVPATERFSPCLCSCVIYDLVSACSDCQGGRIESWSTWSSNCLEDSDSSEASLLANISVPAWATNCDGNVDYSYSRSAASSSALPEGISPSAFASTAASASASILPTPTPTPTSTFQITPTKSSLNSLVTATFGSDRSSVTTSNRTAAIAGGTIGAVVVLAMGAALAYWYVRRRRRRTRVPPSVAYMTVHGSSVY